MPLSRKPEQRVAPSNSPHFCSVRGRLQESRGFATCLLSREEEIVKMNRLKIACEELKGLRGNKRAWCNLRLVGGSLQPVSHLKPNNANFSLQIYAKAWLTLLHQRRYWAESGAKSKKTSQTEPLMLLGPVHLWKGGTDRVWSFCVAAFTCASLWEG